jgi:hypothetical protein
MKVYLSASSIKNFISCPKKCLYRVTQPDLEVPTKKSIIGRIAHKAVELGWDDREIAYKVIKEECKSSRLTKDDVISLQFYVDLFHLNFRPLLGKEDLIEHSFKLPIYDDVFLVGKIDRISNGNVFDWKTGKLPKAMNDIQCFVYDYAYSRIFKSKPKSVCMASLSEGNIVPYLGNKMYESEILDNIIPRMIKTIRERSYERLGMFNESCFKCPYKRACLGGIDVMDSTIVTE